MSKRRTKEQIVRLLRDADQDLAKGLTISDVCRKLGIAENTCSSGRSSGNPSTRCSPAAPAACPS